MDVKIKIKKAIEANGADMEKLEDLFSMVLLCEDLQERRELTLFTVSGKNLHDNAPDACAMLVDFITGGVKVVTVARRVF